MSEMKPTNHRLAWTAAEDAVVRELAGKVPAEAIGRHLNRTRCGVLYRVKKLGLRAVLRGEGHWASKLTSLQAAMIATLRDAGFSAQEIRRGFNLDIGETVIQEIGNSNLWKDNDYRPGSLP